MIKLALIFHLLGASIWVGGHLYLLIRLLPNLIRTNDIQGFLDFEKSYEPLGMTALAVQIITGFYMALSMLPFHMWFNPKMGILSHLLMGKLTWLILTALTAMHAQLRVIKKLKNGTYNDNTLKIMGVHVVLVCVWAVAFVITGAWFRF